MIIPESARWTLSTYNYLYVQKTANKRQRSEIRRQKKSKKKPEKKKNVMIHKSKSTKIDI